MSRGNNGALQRLAEAIADKLPVDWASELKAFPNLRESLKMYAAVERITQASDPHLEEDETLGVEPTSRPSFTMWGRLRVHEKIGTGSFGEVYRAYDPALATEVALKLWKDTRSANFNPEEFLDEARRLARVRHTNVLRIYGADRQHDRVGIWTELVRGTTLEEFLERHGPLGADEATVIGMDLCRALAAVHAAGVVHGDVKTHNVMREKGGRIVLMDFGSSCRLLPSNELHVSTTAKGTPLTMAPEQLRGETAGQTSDLYALGVLLYRLVSGRYPVEAEDLDELLRKHTMGESVPLRDRRPDLPAEFVHVVEKALDLEPVRRYPSAGAMERALAVALGAEVAHGGPEVKPGVEELPATLAGAMMRQRLRRWAPMAVAATLLATAALWLFVFSPFRGVPAPQVTGDQAPALQGENRPTLTETVPESPAVGETQAAAEHSPGPLAHPLTIKANLFRVTPSGHERLLPGGTIAPGDALFLEVEGTEPVHVYVLNEDQTGAAHVLFPAPAFDGGNPLPAGVTHRLPGTRGGQPAYWQVSNAGGREYVLVVASRQPQLALEHDLARLPAATPGTPVVYGTLSDSTVVELVRGIGGVLVAQTDTSGTPPARISSLLAMLGAASRYGPDLWVWQIQLQNPGSR